MDLEQLGGELETLAINIFGENVGWMRAGVQAATNFFEGINKAFGGKKYYKETPIGLMSEEERRKMVDVGDDSWLTTIIKGIFGGESLAARVADQIEHDDWYSVGYAIGEGFRKAVESVDFEAIAMDIAKKLGEELANVNVNMEAFLEGFFEGVGLPETWAEGLADAIADIINPLGWISEQLKKINEEDLRGMVDSLKLLQSLMDGSFIPSLIMAGIEAGVINDKFRQSNEAANSFWNKLKAIVAVIGYVGSMINDFVTGNIKGAIEKAEALEAVLKKKVPPDKLASLLENIEYLIDRGWEWHSILEEPATKTVTVAYRTPGGKAIENPYLGGYVHSGGIVPRTAHSGMVVPGVGTVPTRLWGGEMVITRGQQAKLMHMLRYGFTGGGPGGQATSGSTYNITVNARTADIDERDLMNIIRRYEMLA